MTVDRRDLRDPEAFGERLLAWLADDKLAGGKHSASFAADAMSPIVRDVTDVGPVDRYGDPRLLPEAWSS